MTRAWAPGPSQAVLRAFAGILGDDYLMINIRYSEQALRALSLMPGPPKKPVSRMLFDRDGLPVQVGNGIIVRHR